MASTADFKRGDRVVYRDPFTRKAEDGAVTSANAHNVFVCFGLPGSTSQACDPRSLEHFRGQPDGE